MEVVELFAKGGAVMYLLLISSVTVAAIGIERFRFYSYAAGVKAALAGDNVELALIVHTYFAQRLDENLTVLDKTVNIVLAGLEGQHETP